MTLMYSIELNLRATYHLVYCTQQQMKREKAKAERVWELRAHAHVRSFAPLKFPSALPKERRKEGFLLKRAKGNTNK